uniref:Uncharacterized protein n=1 Tax=Oryza barthii TaxID=65489 RepID=A0A0D3HT71_9ORYZ
MPPSASIASATRNTATTPHACHTTPPTNVAGGGNTVTRPSSSPGNAQNNTSRDSCSTRGVWLNSQNPVTRDGSPPSTAAVAPSPPDDTAAACVAWGRRNEDKVGDEVG